METRSRSWVAVAGLGIAAIGLAMELVSGWGYRHGWWGLRFALRYLSVRLGRDYSLLARTRARWWVSC